MHTGRLYVPPLSGRPQKAGSFLIGQLQQSCRVFWNEESYGMCLHWAVCSSGLFPHTLLYDPSLIMPIFRFMYSGLGWLRLPALISCEAPTTSRFPIKQPHCNWHEDVIIVAELMTVGTVQKDTLCKQVCREFLWAGSERCVCCVTSSIEAHTSSTSVRVSCACAGHDLVCHYISWGKIEVKYEEFICKTNNSVTIKL